MNLRRAGMSLLAVLGCAACAALPEPTSRPEPQPAQPSVVQPVRIGVQPTSPAPQPTPQPTPARPEIFTFAGELTQGGWIRGRVPPSTVSATLDDTALTLDDEGFFFAAFDRDADRQTVLAAALANGRIIRSPVAIAPRDWNIERVDVARRPSGASEAFMQRRRPELERIYLSRQRETGAQGWRQDFIWPVQGRISGRFGSQRIYRGEPGSYHSGLDITTGESGTPFVAPADGVVVLAVEDFSLEGQLLIIDHGQGLNSAFLHASRLLVEEGEQVRQGQHIGDIGSSGRATGPHLHWGLTWRGSRLDPLLFVDGED